MGFLPMTALGIEFLLDGRALAAVPLVMSAIYLPAIVASTRPTPRRRAVLRVVVTASIAMVFVSLPFLGPTLAVVLVPATALPPSQSARRSAIAESNPERTSCCCGTVRMATSRRRIAA